MSFTKTISQLLTSNQALFGTKNFDVKWLREGLYEMGFDKTLAWNADTPDATFDTVTAAALKDFATRNQLETDGKTLSPALLQKLHQRFELLQSLKMLHRAILLEETEIFYDATDPKAEGTIAVEACLRELGFIQPNVNEALTEFATLENVPFNGKNLNKQLAVVLRSCLLYFYGPFFLELPWYESLKHGAIIKENDKNFQVSSGDVNVVFKKYKSGVYNVGNQTIKDFLQTNRDTVRGLNVSDAAIDVMIAVSENEGNLDGINTYDNAYISFGAFQWTLGTGKDGGELAALLKKIKNFQPNAFQEYFGKFGIDVHPSTSTTYGYLTFRGNKVDNQADKDLFRPPHRAFRFWLSGQDNRVKAVQVEHALSRLKNFYWKPDIGVKRYTLAQIISSQYGVALLLDNHVNRPSYVRPCVEKAMTETGLTSDPALWDTKDERKLIEAYLRIREVHGSTPMTDAHRRALVTKKYLDQGVISGDRGSFRYSATGERSLSLDSAPVPPEDYNSRAYPKMTQIRGMERMSDQEKE